MLRSPAGASFYLSRPDETVHYLERAQGIYTALGYTTEHAYLHSNFGEVYTHQGERTQAAGQDYGERFQRIPLRSLPIADKSLVAASNSEG